MLMTDCMNGGWYDVREKYAMNVSWVNEETIWKDGVNSWMKLNEQKHVHIHVC